MLIHFSSAAKGWVALFACILVLSLSGCKMLPKKQQPGKGQKKPYATVQVPSSSLAEKHQQRIDPQNSVYPS